MTDKKEKIKEFIRNNPNLSGNETLKELQKKGLGIRKTNFLEIFRNEKKLPEPTKIKREQSIPIKFRKVKPTKVKPTKVKPTKVKPTKVKPTKVKPTKVKPTKVKPTKVKPIIVKPSIPFEKTKFGKIVKDVQKQRGISEKRAIERVRVLLKIPRHDYVYLNRKDIFVLERHGY